VPRGAANSTYWPRFSLYLGVVAVRSKLKPGNLLSTEDLPPVGADPCTLSSGQT